MQHAKAMWSMLRHTGPYKRRRTNFCARTQISLFSETLLFVRRPQRS